MKIMRIIEIHCVKSTEFSNITTGGSLPAGTHTFKD
jgi:hypothetical protein